MLVLGNGAGSASGVSINAGGVSINVAETSAEIIIDVSGDGSIPYKARIAKAIFGVTILREGQTVLATALHSTALAAARAGHSSVSAGQVLDSAFDGTRLVLHAAASDGGSPYTITAVPGSDRIRWVAVLPGATQVTLRLDLASSGRWYGHGEGGNINGLWPLDNAATPINDPGFSPSSYDMDEPFWFTSKAVGVWVDTWAGMAVTINGGTTGPAAGRADFTIKEGDTLAAETFIERTPRDVHYDYIGIAGKPEKSDAPDIQYMEPVWNTWAMYGRAVTQSDVAAYAQAIRAARLGGYAIQIDDRWQSKYGDFTFDPAKFPDPTTLSRQIHNLGFDLGLWVTLWINLDAKNYPIARDAGYLLKSAADPSQPCTVKWWNGKAGIVDLGNPKAVEWLRNQFHELMTAYNVQGFKFDTLFFDPQCAGTNGLTMKDYQRLGAQFADEFDLQSAGLRAHWTGQQKYGFIARAVDASPDFGPEGLARSVHQALSLSVVGYPFVVTDMVGGSITDNPTDEVLVRWAQAEVAFPFWYGSTSPAGPFTITRAYTPLTTDLYRAAVDEHRKLSPYILKQVRRAVTEGEPIIKPLFFDFPGEPATYTTGDEWLLGDAVLTAPVMTSATSRNIYLPSGTWFDANAQKMLMGPRTISNYPAPLAVLPLFIHMNDQDGPRLASLFDTIPPDLTVPETIKVPEIPFFGRRVFFAASASDVVDPAPVVTCSPAPGSIFYPGKTTVTCTAKDAAGNVSVPKSFTIWVTYPFEGF